MKKKRNNLILEYKLHLKQVTNIHIQKFKSFKRCIVALFSDITRVSAVSSRSKYRDYKSIEKNLYYAKTKSLYFQNL